MSAAHPSIVVFLGPSLRHEEGARILDARYLPPAQFGDVYRLIGTGVREIVLLDGVFHGRAPVWQRELLAAMESGMTVYGASSMGALRAAELHTLGMIGLGAVFEAYASGAIDGDDEVALLHEGREQGYRGLSEPLVNLRFNVGEAVSRGLITSAESAAMLLELKKLPFWERTIPALLRGPTCQTLDPARVAALRAFFANDAINLKQRDAIVALTHVARRAREDAPKASLTAAPRDAGPSHHDRFLLLERWFPQSDGSHLRGQALADHLLSHPERKRLLRLSLAARFFAQASTMGGPAQPHMELDPLKDEALLSTLPEMDMEALKPLSSRARIARALPHVATWCERAGAAPPDEARPRLVERWSDAIHYLSSKGATGACEPFLCAVWALEKGPSYFGFATWSLAAELLRALTHEGIAVDGAPGGEPV